MFQFLIGRLGTRLIIKLYCFSVCFNSLQVGQVLVYQHLDQHHLGSFQFLIGRLGTLTTLPGWPYYIVFQFLIGRLGTHRSRGSTRQSIPGFNSLQVGQVRIIVSLSIPLVFRFQFLIGRLGTIFLVLGIRKEPGFNSLQVGQVPLTQKVISLQLFSFNSLQVGQVQLMEVLTNEEG